MAGWRQAGGRLEADEKAEVKVSVCASFYFETVFFESFGVGVKC